MSMVHKKVHFVAVVCLLAAFGAKGSAQSKETARLRVMLPKKSELYVNGKLTKLTGMTREFESPKLKKGKSFKYTLKAVYPDGGFSVTRMAVAEVKAGSLIVVDMRENPKDGSSSQIIYVPTSESIVEKMIEAAKITKKDLVYDLGCGDGRIIVAAAVKHGARGVGVDIDPVRVKESLANIKKNKVGNLVSVRHGDALKVKDISKATVVMLYMLPEFQKVLAPILKRELKPGTRVVSHDYELPGWTAERVDTVPGPFRRHYVYLYRVGK